MSPQVSVVIANYNYAHFVTEALESVLAQTFTAYEIIVVDDGSTDNSREVLAPYARDPRVRLHFIEHAGHPQAKNHGVAQARGALVAFLDADDRWLPTKLERQLAMFQAQPELAVVYTRVDAIDVEGRLLVREELTPHRGRIAEHLLFENFICFSSAMVRRDRLPSARPFDETLNDPIDYDLWLRLSLKYPFDYIEEPLTRYRVGHASMSRTNSRWREQVDRVIERFVHEYGAREVVPPGVLRRHAYHRLCMMGLYARDHSPAAALGHYVQALRTAPFAGQAWYGLAALAVPESGRRIVRRLRGRAADWRQPQLA